MRSLFPGNPLSIEGFRGNTKDTKTFGNQIQKVADRFGGGEVAFVGDRGMIKSQQIEDLKDFHLMRCHLAEFYTRPPGFDHCSI